MLKLIQIITWLWIVFSLVHSTETTPLKEAWIFRGNDEITSSPLVHDNILYCGCKDGIVYAIDSKTGKSLWQCNIGSSIEKNGVLLPSKIIVFSTKKNEIIALDIDQHQEIWRTSIKGIELSDLATDSTEKIFVANGEKSLIALDIKTGKELWNFTSARTITTSPTYGGKSVCIGDKGGKVYMVSSETGFQEWEFTAIDDIRSKPAIHNNTVLFFSKSGHLYALSKQSGKLLWRFMDNDFGMPKMPEPLVINNTIYIGTYELKALSLETGLKEWTFKENFHWAHFAQPVITNGLFAYVAKYFSGKRGLFINSLETKEIVFELKMKKFARMQPLYLNNLLLLSFKDRGLVAFDIGTLIQQHGSSSTQIFSEKKAISDDTSFSTAIKDTVINTEAAKSGVWSVEWVTPGSFRHRGKFVPVKSPVPFAAAISFFSPYSIKNKYSPHFRLNTTNDTWIENESSMIEGVEYSFFKGYRPLSELQDIFASHNDANILFGEFERFTRAGNRLGWYGLLLDVAGLTSVFVFGLKNSPHHNSKRALAGFIGMTVGLSLGSAGEFMEAKAFKCLHKACTIYSNREEE